MLRNVKDLQGYTIHATDGDLGHVDQFYFDDQQWTIRYLVVDTGNWLSGRKVLIAPRVLDHVDWQTRRLWVNLTREQVEKSPDVDLHRPVSREWESAYHAYYEWPLYWAGAAMTGLPVYPSVFAALEKSRLEQAVEPDADTTPDQTATGGAEGNDAATEGDSHLQSTQDLVSYPLEAKDGSLGHVTDFVVDDETWSIRYLVVDTGHWWPGKKVLIAPAWIERISTSPRQICVNLRRDTIQSSPAYDAAQPISPDYEVRLFEHYGEQLAENVDAPQQPDQL